MQNYKMVNATINSTAAVRTENDGYCKEYAPKIYLAVWGAYSSQEDFCPIEESASQDLPDYC